MKKSILFLLVTSLFFISDLQASYRKLQYQGDLKPEAVAVNWDGIWAVAGEKRKDNRNSDFYLVKWNEKKQDWEKQTLVAEDIFDFKTEGELIGTPDGSLIILSPVNNTMYQWANGKMTKLYEFGKRRGFDNLFSALAATDKDSIFHTYVKGVCLQTIPKRCSFSTYVKKLNPTTEKWEPYGKPLPGLWEKVSAGVDTTGVVGGTYSRKESSGVKGISGAIKRESKVFYWNNTDSKWQQLPIPINGDLRINKIAVAKWNDIWFHLLGAANKIELYQWDGKTLEKKLELDALNPDAMVIDLAAIPGRVVGVDFGGNVGVYEYRKHRIETKPVRPGDRRPPKIGGKTLAPIPLPKKIGEKTVAPR